MRGVLYGYFVCLVEGVGGRVVMLLEGCCCLDNFGCFGCLVQLVMFVYGEVDLVLWGLRGV